MTSDRMKTLSILAVSLVFLGFNIACSQNEPPKANTGSSKTEMTEQEKFEKDIALRNETEVKMMRGEYLHDGASILESVGDIESVPALLVVLEEYPPSPSGAMVCTTSHALDALKKLTGEDAGITHKAWSDWWKNYKKREKVSGRLEKAN